jgi:hypothetical protein
MGWTPRSGSRIDVPKWRCLCNVLRFWSGWKPVAVRITGPRKLQALGKR